ncbi:MAG: DUF3488 domain-containing protein [Candidatus Hydrogenedentes bacterium]|nr:DUF3488 domain-containing protein [Candidatus Hydrogenedentota bacterium]
MHERIARTLRISSALLVFSGYLAMASVADIGPRILILPLLLLLLAPLGERLDKTSSIYRVVSTAIVIAYLCFLPYTLGALGLLPAVVLLVIFVQAYTMLHQKRERNYYHLFLMAFFLLLAACVQSPEPIVGLVLLLFLQSAIWAFLCLRLHVESLAHEGDQNPEIVPLYQTRQNAAPEMQDLFNRGLVFAVSTVSLAAIVLTIVGFRLTPRVEAGLLGRSDTAIARTGLGESVDIRGGQLIQEDATPVMHVRFPEEAGGWADAGSALYWRVTTLNFYGDSQWSRRALLHPLEPGVSRLYPFEGVVELPDLSALRLERRPREKFRRVRQEIYLDRVPENGLPALDLVQKVEVDIVAKDTKMGWDGEKDFTIAYAATGARRLTYNAWSEIKTPDHAALRQSPFDYKDVLNLRDLNLLTGQPLLPETVALAESLTAEYDNAYDKVLALQRWLSGSDFLYSLDVPPLPIAYPIDAFILNVRRGHCQLFATALALMTRSLGIPARVVSGYRGGEWNEGEQAYTVRASMAHLWVEVLFTDIGWVVFDPSPSGEIGEPGALTQITRFFSSAALRAKMFWYREVVGFDSGLQLDKLQSLTLAVISFPFRAERSNEAVVQRDLSGRSTLILFGTALIAAAVFFLGLWRYSRRSPSRRRGQTKEQQRATRLYEKLRARLAQAGIACDGRSAEEIREQVRYFDLADAEEILRMLEVYNDSRFGARPLPEGEYRNYLRAIRRLARA